MSFKLIHSAILATTTNPEILIAEEVKAAVKGLPLKESDPSLVIMKSDYDRWMGVVHDVARDSGVTLSRKTILADIAMDILDNDPKIESQPGDKEVLKSHIIDTLWNAHKATLGHVKVTSQVKKAQEEEEQSTFAQDFRTAQGMEDEEKTPTPLVAGAAVVDENPFPAGTLRHSLWARLHSTPRTSEEEEFQSDEDSVEDVPPADVDADVDVDVDADVDLDSDEAAVDDQPTDEPIVGADEVDPDAVEDEPEPEEVLADVSTEELEAELARRQEEEGGDEGDVDAEAEVDPDAEVDAAPQEEVPDEETDLEDEAQPVVDKKQPTEESADDIAKRITFDDEQEVKSFFRHALTRPAEDLRAAAKDVESEGEKAWANVNLPKNPHPKNSQAYKHWNKGLMRIAKAALGIKDPKPVVTSKQKKR